MRLFLLLLGLWMPGAVMAELGLLILPPQGPQPPCGAEAYSPARRREAFLRHFLHARCLRGSLHRRRVRAMMPFNMGRGSNRAYAPPI